MDNRSETPEYDDMVTEEDELPVKLEEHVMPRTVSEAEQETTTTSDIQAILRSLTPESKNTELNELCKSAMVSRIPPDVLMDKHFLISASLIEEQCYEEGFNPVQIISQAQDFLMIGLEGQGIIDRLEMAGVAHEAEMEKLSKELGI